MAYTTTARTTAGFEPIYNKSLGAVPNPVEYELTPNTAFSRGDMVVITNGKIAKAAANAGLTYATKVVGVMAESFTTATNPTASKTFGRVYDHPDNVYRCSFSDQVDSTADSGTTTTIVDATLSTATDDIYNGALLYIYEGTNVGEVRTVSDFDHGTDTLTVAPAFPSAIDTTSKYIMLAGGNEADDSINVGSVGTNIKDENTIDGDGRRLSSDVPQGPLTPIAIYPADLMMDVIVRRSCHIFGY